MRVVARRKGQRIVLGGEIVLVVTEVARGTVKLGISAPARCTIIRGEVHDAIEAANRQALASTVESAARATKSER